MNFYRELDFPVIPDELIEELVIAGNIASTSNSSFGRQHYKDGILLNPAKYSAVSNSSPALMDWLIKNINYFDTIATVHWSEHPTGGTHIVHSDFTRKFAINYLWETGGDNVRTTWYQEAGKPLDRTTYQRGQQSDLGFVDYKDLTELDSVVCVAKHWYLIDTSTLHDAGLIVGRRKGLSIGLHNDKVLDIMGISKLN